MKREFIFLCTILMLAAFLRFWQLGIVPQGVTNDEMGYIYNSYSIAMTGRNVFGDFLPFLTWVNQGGYPFLPVSTYVSIPFFWLFGLSAAVGRLPSAILGVMDIVLLYLLVMQLFKDRTLALLSSLFLAISPWHLHFSRSAYDPNYALFFYLLGTVVFFNETEHKKLPIFSSLSFLVAIFSYRGMNVIFLPLTLILGWYGITVLKISRRQVVTFGIGVILILVSLTSVILINGKNYIAESFSTDGSKMQEDIDTQIREAQGPLFVRRLFLNKITYRINTLRENYVRAYSPEFLFLYTEPNKIYSIWSRGRIYFIDLFLIIAGIAYLCKIKRNAAHFIILMILIGGLPGMIGGFPYSARNLFLSLFFPVLSAGGVLFLLLNDSLKRLRKLFIVLFILVYSYLIGGYLFDYYGRYAYYGAEPWFKSLKEVSSVIMQNKTKYTIVTVGTSSFPDLLQYAFYSVTSPTLVQKAWQERQNNTAYSFTINNIHFTTSCLTDKDGYITKDTLQNKQLVIVHDRCGKKSVPDHAIRDYFGNVVWKIYSL